LQGRIENAERKEERKRAGLEIICNLIVQSSVCPRLSMVHPKSEVIYKIICLLDHSDNCLPHLAGALLPLVQPPGQPKNITIRLMVETSVDHELIVNALQYPGNANGIRVHAMSVAGAKENPPRQPLPSQLWRRKLQDPSMHWL